LGRSEASRGLSPSPEERMSEHQEASREKLEALRGRGIDPYPHSFSITHRAAQILAWGDAVTDAEGAEVTVAGRLVAKREHGKAGFGHLLDDTGRLQFYCREDGLGAGRYELYRDLSVGDWVGIAGRVFRTRTGEITVKARAITL